MSWLDRLTAGFKKTADKVGENITGLVKEQALDTATLDDIEEALIASDLGPEASKRIRDGIAASAPSSPKRSRQSWRPWPSRWMSGASRARMSSW
jgi:signal recognition particle GTPase